MVVFKSCIICGGRTDPGWGVCDVCAAEEIDEKTYEDQYAREFAEKNYEEQEELRFLDDMLFGGH